MSKNISVLNPTNLVFIMFDDLRPELSIYGRHHMITPNFERLAKKSVVFDYAFSQISVCNPSRDSLLTGLRPDTIGVYGFQHSFRPHMIFPTQLARSGYNTAGYGKILHWDGNDKNIWSYDEWENNWYEYQGSEGAKYMNASNMADKTRPEEWFRDHQFTSRMIQTMHELHNKTDASGKPENFMAAIGFKLPHIAVHMPYKYYDMYRNKSDAFKLTTEELTFPPTTPSASYRIGEVAFTYMQDEGATKSTNSTPIGDINVPISYQMRLELMWSYCAAVSFLDVQIGRILDTMDELNLWENTTVILTADHGMHNGEKGIWEKWTLFDESTRVPLLISHPKSPFQGSHYKSPVELLDIYPTVLDLVAPPYDMQKVCKPDDICKPLQGKSLAQIVLGDEAANKIDEEYTKRGVRPDRNKFEFARRRKVRRKNGQFLILPGEKDNFHLINNATTTNSTSYARRIYDLHHNFAISQTLRCGKKNIVLPEITYLKKLSQGGKPRNDRASTAWMACDEPDVSDATLSQEVSVMGYSMRTPYYRYVAWVYFDKKKKIPKLKEALLDEELYDHRKETLEDYTHRETVNVAKKPEFKDVIVRLRDRLLSYLRKNIVTHPEEPPAVASKS